MRNQTLCAQVPMSCHKATVVITGRAHCFHDCIYITHILLWDLSTPCVMDHLWLLILCYLLILLSMLWYHALVHWCQQCVQCDCIYIFMYIYFGFEFSKFSQQGGGSNSFHKKGWVGKNEGGVFLKRVNHLFSHQLTLMSSFSVCGACVLIVYTISISVLCISQKRLVLLNLISRNVVSACE